MKLPKKSQKHKRLAIRKGLAIRTQLIASFLVVALIVALVGTVGYSSLNRMYEMQEEFANKRIPSVQSLLIVSEAQTSINNSVNQILINAINGRDYKEQLNSIENAFKKAENEWNAYTQIATTEEEQDMIKEFNLFWNAWKNNIDDFIELAKQYNETGSEDDKAMMVIKNIGGNDRYYTNSKTELEELVELNIQYANATKENAKMMYDNIAKLLISIEIVGFLLALILGLYLSSSISKPIVASVSIANEIAKGNLKVNIKNKQSTKEIAQMYMSINQMVDGLKELIEKISMTSKALIASSHQLATVSEEASSASTNIATTVNQLSEGSAELAQEMQNINNNINDAGNEIDQMSINAARVVEGSKRVLEASNNGLVVSENAINKIKAIQETSIETFKVMNMLGEESKKINEIVDVIRGISEQTNLLALNAAIEAARAGEYGKGFAVVADEVRKLAEQSNNYAQQIAEVITKIYEEIEMAVQNMNDSTKEVEEGVVIVNEAGNSFRTIVGEIENIVSQIEKVNESIQSVVNRTKEIAKSISNTTAITEESAASTEEISASAQEQTAAIEEVAASSQELARMAEELNAAVSRFIL